MYEIKLICPTCGQEYTAKRKTKCLRVNDCIECRIKKQKEKSHERYQQRVEGTIRRQYDKTGFYKKEEVDELKNIEGADETKTKTNEIEIDHEKETKKKKKPEKPKPEFSIDEISRMAKEKGLSYGKMSAMLTAHKHIPKTYLRGEI